MAKYKVAQGCEWRKHHIHAGATDERWPESPVNQQTDRDGRSIGHGTNTQQIINP